MEQVTKLHFRQYKFLQDLREAAETGLCDRPWPRVTTLRRWLRRPGFRAALRSLQSAIRVQRDFMLAVSAAQASRNLAAMISEQDPRCGLADPDARLTSLVRIIRAEQIRQRDQARRRKVRASPAIESRAVVEAPEAVSDGATSPFCRAGFNLPMPNARRESAG